MFFCTLLQKGAVKRPSRPVFHQKVHRSRGGIGDLKKRLGALLFREVFMTIPRGLQVPPPSHGLGVGTHLGL